MNNSLISLRHLSKSFRSHQAVNDLNLEVFEGDVFGFLGPNGAGKSTTIRMMLSLIEPDNGDIFLFGKNLKQHRSGILKRIGCIVEKPDFYLYLSAEKNLQLLSRLSGYAPSRPGLYEVLELVGLKGREKDPVKTYSHGMKQRLGIAQTLIHDPDLIILDEPTTGLDPQGMIDVRNLILHLKNDRGKTIFLSSHILAEIELIATRMAIINNGKTVVQGAVNELLSSQDLIVTIETDNVLRAREAIENSRWKIDLKESSSASLMLSITKNDIPEVVRLLEAAVVKIFSVTYRRTLEDYFLKLTSEEDAVSKPAKSFSF